MPDVISAFAAGSAFILFIWFMVYVSSNYQEQQREFYSKGYKFSTAHSLRIAGVVRQRVSEGRWVLSIESIWRSNYSEEYFLLIIDELRSSSMILIDKRNAIEWVERNIDEHSEKNKLLKDWFKAI